MSFRIKDNCVLVKYNDICNRIIGLLGIRFHSNPVYDKKYIKAKVKAFNGVVQTIFRGNEIPREGVHCTFIGAINADSVMKIDKKNYPQVYLEACKFEIKKKKMV